MPVRGIRGAITVHVDEPEVILNATNELLQAVSNANPDLQTEDIASVLFTTTDDLNSVYPARAAREMGWDLVPLMCAQEIAVPGSLPKCIRVLIHWNTYLSQKQIQHVYLKEATSLRPDIVASYQQDEQSLNNSFA
jgi:chorismate mutase